MKFLVSIIFLISLNVFCSEDLTASSSCNVDLDQNGFIDNVLYLKSKQKGEVIVLLRGSNSSVTSYKLAEFQIDPVIKCIKEKRISETKAGKNNVSKTHTTNGSYVLLDQLEGSASAHYFKNGKFVEVWVKD